MRWPRWVAPSLTRAGRGARACLLLDEDAPLGVELAHFETTRNVLNTYMAAEVDKRVTALADPARRQREIEEKAAELAAALYIEDGLRGAAESLSAAPEAEEAEQSAPAVEGPESAPQGDLRGLRALQRWSDDPDDGSPFRRTR